MENNYERAKALFAGDYNAYTPTLKSQFKKKKRYGVVPKPGFFVFFYKASRGDVGHIGIVDTVEYRNGSYTMTTIEGNTSAGQNNTVNPDGGKVAYKTYNFLPSQVGGGNMIDGFGDPDYHSGFVFAEQLIAVARSQVGYLEKASNKDLDSFTKNAGKNNWTKYGEWAEKCGWGYNPAAWCAMFCCWVGYTAVVCASDYTPGWISQGTDWMFRKDNGELCADEWLYNGGRWYVFDGSGKMIRGWFRQGDEWYYMAEDGGMLSSQWVWDKGKSYYLTASGLMAAKAYVKADKPYGPGNAYIYYFVGADGAWIPEMDTDNPDLESYEVAK